MNIACKITGMATGMLMMAAVGASAATVELIDTSTQGAGNQAHIFGAGYEAYTNGGASWDVDPTWTPPPINESGISQSPFNNTPSPFNETSYFAVGEEFEGNGAASPATLTFGKVQTVFKMLWGSIDAYNTISFSNGASWTGTDIINAFGLQGSPGNFEQVALLRFDFGDDGFNSVTFTSSQNAFEFALAPVPLPAGGLLLVTALGGAAALRRRRKAA